MQLLKWRSFRKPYAIIFAAHESRTLLRAELCSLQPKRRLRRQPPQRRLSIFPMAHAAHTPTHSQLGMARAVSMNWQDESLGVARNAFAAFLRPRKLWEKPSRVLTSAEEQ